MSDLIDRQQAIDVIDKEQKEIDVSDVSAMYAYSKCKTIIKQLPSALGTNLAEVGMDCISRQNAIDALRNYLVGKNFSCDGTLTCRLIENEVINKLPSAQPTFDARDTQYNLPIGTDMIDRQQAIKEAESWVGINWYEQHLQRNVVEWLKELPPAQPDLSEYSDKLWQKAYERGKAEAQAEIVRCKDCRFNTYSKKCLNPDSFFLVPADDFYCGYAERRTDE